MSKELRVLIVDDHPVNRLVLTEIFRQLGCEVATAEDGGQALSAWAPDHFDLVCLDRHMPGLSGDDVVGRLPDDQFVLAWSTDLTDLPARSQSALGARRSGPCSRGLRYVGTGLTSHAGQFCTPRPGRPFSSPLHSAGSIRRHRSTPHE